MRKRSKAVSRSGINSVKLSPPARAAPLETSQLLRSARALRSWIAASTGAALRRSSSAAAFLSSGCLLTAGRRCLTLKKLKKRGKRLFGSFLGQVVSGGHNLALDLRALLAPHSHHVEKLGNGAALSPQNQHGAAHAACPSLFRVDQVDARSCAVILASGVNRLRIAK